MTLFVVEYELFVFQRTREEIKRACVLEYRGTTTKLHMYFATLPPYFCGRDATSFSKNKKSKRKRLLFISI